MVESKAIKLLRTYVKRGMHLNSDGKVVMPDGKVHKGSVTYKTKGKPKYRTLFLHSEDRKYGVHVLYARAVCWLAYGPPPPGKPVADHINRNRLDDRPENLRWASYSENNRNVSWVTKAIRKKNLPCMVGSQNPQHKLTEEDVKKMRKLHATGKFSCGKIGKMFKISKSLAWQIVTGRAWKHVKGD